MNDDLERQFERLMRDPLRGAACCSAAPRAR